MKPTRFLATLASTCAVATSALADAVPPEPEHCPSGQVGVTSHSGPECVLEAPKNCPPGYRGVLRGKCVLATCSADGQCDNGRRCLPIQTCQEFRELHWSGWGWSAKTEAPKRDNFFAEPPSPQPEGPPKKAWVLLHICGQDGPCNAPAECRPTSLCYPPEAVGQTGATAGGAPDTGNDNGTYVDETASPVTRQAPTTSSDSGGCRRGCTAGSNVSVLGWLALPLLGALALWRRRLGWTAPARSRTRPPR
jgi:hypothetical protein